MLFAPAALLFVVLATACVGWWIGQGRLSAAIDARAEALRGSGWAVAWRERTVSGFPFRLKVLLSDVSLAGPGEHAWGVSAPQIEAQAYLIQPTHWVFAAAQGLTIRRPVGGAVIVSGKDLRASVAGVNASPWRIALAGDALAFATPPDAKPFSFAAMQHFEAHLRPTADGTRDGDVLVEVDGGQANRRSLIWNLAQDAPVSIAATGRLTKLAEARGGGAGQALTAWSAAGGALRVDRLSGAGGRAHVEGAQGLLGLDGSGRLEGALPLTLRQDPVEVGAGGEVRSPAIAAQAGGAAGGGVDLPVIFKDGRMRLGPVDVGPAPMLR